MDRMAAVDLALDWLANSDIRHAEGVCPARGGVNHGYDWRQRRYTFVYSEITGYAVSAFANAYRWTKDEKYVSLAGQAAGSLMGVQRLAKEMLAGAVLHGLSLPDMEPRHQYHSFDAAMCLQGLLDLYAINPTPELRASAQAIGDWLVGEMQQENGSFLSMYDAETSEWHHQAGYFYDDGGCLHAKHAIGLLKLGLLTGDDRYVSAARRLCDWVLGLQGEDGAIRAAEHLPHVVSHPHCYATEGLLFAYHSLGTDRYLDAARRAGLWLLTVQNRDGSINIEYKRAWWRMGRRVTEKLFPRRVTDATAQAIRIWLTLHYLDGDRQWVDACHRAERFLLGMQCVRSQDRNAVGGFLFWPGHPIMFAWCTMFAIHALYALENVNRTEGHQHMMRELF